MVSNLGEEFCTVTPVTPFVVFTLRCCVNKSQYKGAHLMIEETKNYVKNKLHSGGEKVNDDVDLAAIKVSCLNNFQSISIKQPVIIFSIN